MKNILLISMFMALASSCQSQKLANDSLLLSTKVDIDSLCNQLVYSKDFPDSIKIYEYNILREIDIVIQKLRKSQSIRTEEDKKSLIASLEEYQKSVFSIHLISDVLRNSYGLIPRERSIISGLLYFKRIKEEYFTLMAILDNVYSNFFLSWED